ncbi:GTP-binding protein [Tilletia horrida]|uniref:GTP-binding protein n=1 Tax=Tilletia horrida TaxID=155126 RepID=A0AAN6GBT7_9BASI|nr:GTP-binding protein [Tilletia horrida]KAK0524461.1 GTP-binding protein [Tilletia horrida]KAK0532182.1 GTP-binding protein [Tilletia horrida]KAK0561288.1 GTP-binding protein [Tilletia horrida]
MSLAGTADAPSSSQEARKRKLVVLGSRAVGKSSLCHRYVEKTFLPLYYPTIASNFDKELTLNGHPYILEIHDTAGQDEYSILNSKHAIGIHGYLLVYSVDSRVSFEMIETIRDKILSYTGTETVPAVIVGQKCDLHLQRQVSEEEGKELAARLKCAWVEASAREDINVDKIFELCLTEIDPPGRPDGPEPQPSKCIVQ